MKINIFNESKIFFKQNKSNNNSAITTIQNKIISKTEKKEKAEVTTINKTLNETSTSDNTKKDVSSTVDYINYLYTPIEDTVKTLSSDSKLYNQYSDELKSNKLSEDEKDKIQSELDNTKKDILQLTSSDYISTVDKYLSSTVAPKVKAALSELNSDTGNNLNTNSMLVTSLESIGLKSNNNMNFDQVLNEIKSSKGYFYKNVISKLDDMNSTYGNAPNKDATKKTDIDLYA
ncbi:MAG: hypothetical protein PHX70_05600 [Clostridium sp.]|nr:hypothetical protein [Clostridium sp.]